MWIQQSIRDRCTIVALIGRLDHRTVPSIQQVLLRLLREQPIAVICDLSGLRALDPTCADVFASVAHHPASDWPAVKLLLCGARPAQATILSCMSEPYRLPLHGSVEDAMDQASTQLTELSDEMALSSYSTVPVRPASRHSD